MFRVYNPRIIHLYKYSLVALEQLGVKPRHFRGDAFDDGRIDGDR